MPTERFRVMDEDLRPSFFGFHDLMSWRVERILLVASLYDSFVLEEDGRLTERIFSDYASLSLSYPPRVTPVRSVAKALKALDAKSFDLVVLMLRLPDTDSAAFVSEVKRRHPGMPMILLTWDGVGLDQRLEMMRGAGVDRSFLWNGDTSIFLALIKSMEDQANLDVDVRKGDVRVVVVVEDSVRYYSTFMPMLYREIMGQTAALIDEGLNDFHKLFRMRARPKLVLATTFEEAIEVFESYPLNVLGFLSDISFPRKGVKDPDAGFELVRAVRRWAPDIPFMLLSSEPKNAEKAKGLNTLFLDKNSPTMVSGVRRFLKRNLGFGDFFFRLPDGTEIGRASDLEGLLALLETAPAEAVRFHSKGNHFSHWLAARGEFALARKIRPRRLQDFKDTEALRLDLIRRITKAQDAMQRGVIADFNPSRYYMTRTFSRLGGGSLGGKSRSLAFLGAMLERAKLEERFPKVKIGVPRTVALGAYVFEQFVERNNLEESLGSREDDQETADAFVAGEFGDDGVASLRRVLERVTSPLAVRSSSLLEDSPNQPFAGVFSTYMLPNNHTDLDVRLGQVLRAIKLVYASTWFKGARNYLRAVGYGSVEMMGVAIQELVGRQHGDVFYPDVSGVAQTYNFYPVRYLKPEEGAALLALGLGKTITDGGACLRFSPHHPEVQPQLSVLSTVLDTTQRELWALDLSQPEAEVTFGSDYPLIKLGLDAAEEHGVLRNLGSVYCAQDDRLKDGISSPGPRVLSFAPLLKWKVFPIAAILSEVLERAREAMAGPAEIEFSAVVHGPNPEFNLLQIRPLTVVETSSPVQLDGDPSEQLVSSSRALGHGRRDGITDVVYVKAEAFDRTVTPAIAAEVSRCNDDLLDARRPYVLIGPGRWGTSDPFVGIPVSWEDVCGATVLVEADLPGFEVEPSQGSHFFHNLTSFKVFTLTVSFRKEGEHFDREWLDALPAVWEGTYVRRITLDAPLCVVVDGRRSAGRIFKPKTGA
jgi:CheY-like chemotaxis protein